MEPGLASDGPQEEQARKHVDNLVSLKQARSGQHRRARSSTAGSESNAGTIRHQSLQDSGGPSQPAIKSDNSSRGPSAERHRSKSNAGTERQREVRFSIEDLAERLEVGDDLSTAKAGATAHGSWNQVSESGRGKPRASIKESAPDLKNASHTATVRTSDDERHPLTIPMQKLSDVNKIPFSPPSAHSSLSGKPSCGQRLKGYSKPYVCIDAFLCPCELWSFTEERLRCLEHGESALDLDFVHVDGYRESNKTIVKAFLFCYYPASIFEHRKRIGVQYGFRPNWWDWLKGCACPCWIIYHNEIYIVKAEAAKEANLPSEKRQEPYKSQMPMSVPGNTDTLPRAVPQGPRTLINGNEVKSSSSAKTRSPPGSLAHRSFENAPQSPSSMPTIPERAQSKLGAEMSAGTVSNTDPKGDPIEESATDSAAGVGSEKDKPSWTSFPMAAVKAVSDAVGISSNRESSIDEKPRPQSVSPLQLHDISADTIETTPPGSRPHHLSDDQTVQTQTLPTNLHALHLDPIPGTVVPQEHTPTVQPPHRILTMPRAPQPLAPKIHRLSQDVSAGLAPGAFPPSSPTPGSPAPMEGHEHDLETDARVEMKHPDRGEGERGHALESDTRVPMSWPFSKPTVNTPQTSLPAHDLGGDITDEFIPSGETGFELHRLSEDMLTPNVS